MNYACDKETEDIGTVYAKTFGKYEYKQFGPDTCDREMDLDEPEDYIHDSLEDTVIDDFGDEYDNEY